MPTHHLQPGMYDRRDPSLAQRIAVAALSGLWIILAWWLLAEGGLRIVGFWLGHSWNSGHRLRDLALATAFSIYYVRILFTQFVFLKRGVVWGEALGIALWILIIVLLLSFAAGTNSTLPGAAALCGAVVFVFGSWMNTSAEHARHVWKQLPPHQEMLFTGGLFRYTRHPNYLGDLLSFSGLCLISGVWWTAVIPLIMLAGFVFVNIPMLDRHLAGHYGPAFETYARKTSKLVPFVY